MAERDESTGAPRQPAKWKLAILTALAIYPLLIVLIPLSRRLLGDVPLWLGIIPVIAVAVSLMTWVVMPLLTRALDGWLRR